MKLATAVDQAPPKNEVAEALTCPGRFIGCPGRKCSESVESVVCSGRRPQTSEYLRQALAEIAPKQLKQAQITLPEACRGRKCSESSESSESSACSGRRPQAPKTNPRHTGDCGKLPDASPEEAARDETGWGCMVLG